MLLPVIVSVDFLNVFYTGIVAQSTFAPEQVTHFIVKEERKLMDSHGVCWSYHVF